MGEYHTLGGYPKSGLGGMTKNMEDYLEMVCRMEEAEPAVRLSRLAEALNVSPSSATRVAKQLNMLGYVNYKPYEYIRLTERGGETGRYLLYRHRVLQDFLETVNGGGDVLEQTELIEHHVSAETVRNIERATDALRRAGFRP